MINIKFHENLLSGSRGHVSDKRAMLQLFFLLRRHQKRLQLEETSAIIVPNSGTLQETQTRNGKKQKRNNDGKCGCSCGKVQISEKRNKE